METIVTLCDVARSHSEALKVLKGGGQSMERIGSKPQ
jgi:hypothetical protein